MADAPAWYGKLAALGDFAQRRAPPHWVERLDPWLAASMAAGRAALGERWLPCYLTAPLLRWAWAPGVIDTQWWFGLLMPSCDSVGRYFPLLLGQARARPPADRIALDHLELWYEHLARAALRTLDGGNASLQDFEHALHDAPPWPTAGQAPAQVDTTAPPGERWRGAPGLALAQWAHALAAAGLVQQLEGHSLWSAGGDRLDVLPGLPCGAAFVRLFEGQ